MAVGTNALETQTNYFLNHWVPNLRGTSSDKKKAEFGTEQTAPGQDHLRRSAPHTNHRGVRGGGRRGQRAASRDQSRHRSRAVQRAVHRDRRQGVGRSRLHRRQHRRLRQCRQGEPYHHRTGRADHRPEARGHPQGGRMDRPAEAGRRAAADHVRLREGADLGQRQLPHQPGAGEHRAGHRQRRPARAAAACAWAGTRRATCGRTIPADARRRTSTSF